MMYFTPERVAAYIKGGIIDPSEPASNFLADAYEIIMGKPPYGRA